MTPNPSPESDTLLSVADRRAKGNAESIPCMEKDERTPLVPPARVELSAPDPQIACNRDRAPGGREVTARHRDRDPLRREMAYAYVTEFDSGDDRSTINFDAGMSRIFEGGNPDGASTSAPGSTTMASSACTRSGTRARIGNAS
jgi:hypothetical protein